MRQIIILILTISIMSLFFTACTSGGTETNTDTGPDTVATDTSDSTPDPADTTEPEVTEVEGAVDGSADTAETPEEKPEGFDNWSFPDDWPEEVPALHEFWFTEYTWEENHMHAAGDGEIVISRVFNYHENFTNVGWEKDRESEWVRDGEERKLWMKREGMVIEVTMTKIDDANTHLELDLDLVE